MFTRSTFIFCLPLVKLFPNRVLEPPLCVESGLCCACLLCASDTRDNQPAIFCCVCWCYTRYSCVHLSFYTYNPSFSFFFPDNDFVPGRPDDGGHAPYPPRHYFHPRGSGGGPRYFGPAGHAGVGAPHGPVKEVCKYWTGKGRDDQW